MQADFQVDFEMKMRRRNGLAQAGAERNTDIDADTTLRLITDGAGGWTEKGRRGRVG